MGQKHKRDTHFSLPFGFGVLLQSISTVGEPSHTRFSFVRGKTIELHSIWRGKTGRRAIHRSHRHRFQLLRTHSSRENNSTSFGAISKSIRAAESWRYSNESVSYCRSMRGRKVQAITHRIYTAMNVFALLYLRSSSSERLTLRAARIAIHRRRNLKRTTRERIHKRRASNASRVPRSRACIAPRPRRNKSISN